MTRASNITDNTWRQRMCAQCSPDLGHCPMRFYEGKQRDHSSYGEMDVCLCHTEYNHCIANNENGYIIEIDPHMDVSSLNMTSAAEFNRPTTTTTTTTQTPELKQALGFEVNNALTKPLSTSPAHISWKGQMRPEVTTFLIKLVTTITKGEKKLQNSEDYSLQLIL